MSMFKKLSLILSTLMVMSCDRVDKVSPLGSDVIGKIDSSAVGYDGVFHSEDLKAGFGEWVSMTDNLSGLHRYEDSLSNRHGNIQSEIVLGRFSSEEAFGYTTFYPTLDIDTTIKKVIKDGDTTDVPVHDTTELVHTIGWYVDSLLRHAKKDSVSTAMTLFIDTTQQSLDLYNLELSTLPFVVDSTAPDTSAREPLQNVLVPRGERRYTFSLPYHYYQKKDADTVENHIELTGIEERFYTKSIVTTTQRWKGDELTEEKSATTPVDMIDTFSFDATEVYPYYTFSDIDSTISPDTIFNNPLGTSEVHFVDTAANDTVRHFFLTDPVNYSDSLYISMNDTVINSDTTVETFPSGSTYDSIYHILDTVHLYNSKTVTQKGEAATTTIGFSTRFAYDGDDSIQNIDTAFLNAGGHILDTLNILMKNSTANDNSLLHLTGRPWLRVVGHKEGAADDTITILPQRSSMTVFEQGTPIPTTEVTASGGMEVFTKLNLNSANFWKMMNNERYLSIVNATVEVPVKSVEFAHEGDEKLSLRAMFYQKNLKNGALLSDSTIYDSKSVEYYADSSSLKIDVTDYLINLRWGIESTVTPPTYLYLWIDGSKMGRITFDKESPYRFTYIVQNKAN